MTIPSDADRTTDLAVETHGLTKRFGAQTAVDGIDVAVPRGAVFGFLGPNGSGKTTTIRMMLGLIRPSGGQAMVLGSKIRALMDGRLNVSFDDIRAVALPALRHRMILNFEAEAEGITTDDVLNGLVNEVPESAA